MKCECSEPGLCPVYKRVVSQREYEQCSERCPENRPCDPVKSESLRQVWLKWAQPSADTPSLPSLGRQVLNFGKAVAKHVAGGLQPTSPQEQQRRLTICDGCEFSIPKDKPVEDRKCSKCGCPIKKKSGWLTETCPIELWKIPITKGGCGCKKS